MNTPHIILDFLPSLCQKLSDLVQVWRSYNENNFACFFWDTVYIRTGNDNLHLLTSGKRQRLRVDLTDFEGNSRYAEYDNFKVGSASDKYKLSSLGTYSGTAGLLDCSRSTAVHC